MNPDLPRSSKSKSVEKAGQNSFKDPKSWAPGLSPEQLQSLKPPAVVVPDQNSKSDHQAIETGQRALRDGKVACIVVAGGQATRLGISQPKGTVDFLGKTLFQRFCEQLTDLRKRFSASIPLYVMTSDATDRETQEFFKRENYFGLAADDVVLFRQQSVPTLDRKSGEALLSNGEPVTNPDGHGGLLEGAKNGGVFNHAKKRGIETLYYFQIDNPLALIGDPLFVGYHILQRSLYSLKVVRKVDPQEKLGMVCANGSSLTVVEYSELPDSLRFAIRDDGSLAFHAGSIAIHAFDCKWLEKMAGSPDSLLWHRAEKKVKVNNAKGQIVEVDAIKYEKFIFDLLPKAERSLVLETSRELEFAPIKNQSGPDSPETAAAQFKKVESAWQKLREERLS